MGKISILDELTINQIAAGEVIERPASVIKELVENSIDAGARKIEIHLHHGGRQKIQVVDDGEGMDRNDALLAFERHATSKLRRLEDLERISSLGFRGEALPSIAAVSRIILQTATAPGVPGTKVTVEGGKIISVEQCGLPKGTNITVEDLFFNTPARYKFLKTIPSEVSQIKEVVTSLVLGHHEISFRLCHQNMELINTIGGDDLLQTVNQVFNPSLCRELIPVEGSYGPMKISGLIGRPTIAKANRGAQYFYLNKRLIRSRLLSSAAEKAYGTLLPVARFPFLLLNMELPPELVDVNVHPNKLEVRFKDEKEIYRGVLLILREHLQTKLIETSWVPKYHPSANYPAREYSSAVREELPFTWSSETTPHIKYVPEKKYVPAISKPAGEQAEELPKIYSHKFLNLFNTYLLLEAEDGLLLVDQHAAHERIIYDRLLKQADQPGQYFLTPMTIELTPEQRSTAEEKKELLSEVGFEFEEFGPQTLLLRSGPHGVSGGEAQDLFLNLIMEWSKSGEAKKRVDKETALMIMACRQAVKAGDQLSAEESATLLTELWKTDLPQTCPHGRPTMVSLSKEEIERIFKRR